MTDQGVKELAALKNLADLSLGQTQVTDAGLKELVALKSLTKLGLVESKVTPDGVKDFRQARPDCRVFR